MIDLAELWEWLSEPEHQTTLAFLGGGLAAVIVAGWTLYVHLEKKRSSSSSAPAPAHTSRVSAAEGGAAAGGDMTDSPAVSGDHNVVTVTRIEGISTEPHQALVEELGVTKAALTSFFKILERKQVLPEDLDSTLREIATHYNELVWKLEHQYRTRTGAFSYRLSTSLITPDTDEARANAVIREGVFLRLAEQRVEALHALKMGALARTEALLADAISGVAHGKGSFPGGLLDLHEAAAHLRSMNAIPEPVYRILAAMSAAELGDLKCAQLEYAEAAAYYREAAAHLPPGEELLRIRAEYLSKEEYRWFDAGGYENVQKLLRRALEINEEALGPQHLHTVRVRKQYERLEAEMKEARAQIESSDDR